MTEEMIFKLIANVGFPAVVTWILLKMIGKTLENMGDMKKSIDTLIITIANGTQATIKQNEKIANLTDAVILLFDKLGCHDESRQLRDNEDEKIRVVK